MPDVLEVIAKIRKEGSLDDLTKELSKFQRTSMGMTSVLNRLDNVFTSVFNSIKQATTDLKSEIAFEDMAQEMSVNSDEYLTHLRTITDGTVSSTELMRGAVEDFAEGGQIALRAYEMELEAAWLEMSEGERSIASLTTLIDEMTTSFGDSLAMGLQPWIDGIREALGIVGEFGNLLQLGQSMVLGMTGVLHALTEEQMSWNEAMEFGQQVVDEFYRQEEIRLAQQRENIRAAEELRAQAQELNRARLESVQVLEQLTRAEERYWDRLEQLSDQGTERLINIQQKYLDRREDLWRDTNLRQQDSWLDHTRTLEDIEQRYRDRIQDINERSDINLEDAIRRRDARAIVEAKRRKVDELDQAARDRNRAIRDEQQDYQRELSDIQVQYSRRQEELELQYSREQTALQRWLAQRREMMRAAYVQEYNDLVANMVRVNAIIQRLGASGLGIPQPAAGTTGRQMRFTTGAPHGGYDQSRVTTGTPHGGSGYGQFPLTGAAGGAFAGMQRGGAFETTVPTGIVTSEFGQREGVVVAPGGLENLGRMLGKGGDGAGQDIRVHLTIEGDEIVKSIVRDVVVEEMIEG